MSFRPDNTAHRVAFAIAVSLLLHGAIMWGSDIRLPYFKPLPPPLSAKLEALPGGATAKLKPRPKPVRKTRPTDQKPVLEPAPKLAPEPDPEPAPEPTPQAETPPQELPLAASAVAAASETTAASAPVETGTLEPEAPAAVERPPLPKRARLTFAISTGKGFLVGEAVHTLEIDEGRYQLQAVTRTIGLARLFKSYTLTQNSSGGYGRAGLVPEQFTEERKDSSGTKRITAHFDHATRFASLSSDSEVALPPGTQDILSILYQFPPLQGVEIAAVSVSNGKKIEKYEFEIVADEEIDTALGKLLTVRMSKLHGPNQEGLEIWLAREYRLFPVKMQFIEKNGEITGEAVITDIRVSEEEGARIDVIN